MRSNPVLERLAPSWPACQPDSARLPVQCCATASNHDAGPACPGAAGAPSAAAATSPSTHPADPPWWILHRLASPQPFPMTGLPASARPMVGDRTWRRCRDFGRP